MLRSSESFQRENVDCIGSTSTLYQLVVQTLSFHRRYQVSLVITLHVMFPLPLMSLNGSANVCKWPSTASLTELKHQTAPHCSVSSSNFIEAISTLRAESLSISPVQANRLNQTWETRAGKIFLLQFCLKWSSSSRYTFPPHNSTLPQRTAIHR